MVRMARRHATITVVNHSRRWKPKYLAAKKLIELGAIGVPESIVSSFSGNFIHTGTHAFDVMRFLFGEAVSVRGTPDPAALDRDSAERFAGDVGGSGTIRFRDGTAVARTWEHPRGGGEKPRQRRQSREVQRPEARPSHRRTRGRVA